MLSAILDPLLYFLSMFYYRIVQYCPGDDVGRKFLDKFLHNIAASISTIDLSIDDDPKSLGRVMT